MILLFLITYSSKSPLVSGTPLSILADCKEAVIWILLFLSLTDPLQILRGLLESPITIGITVTFMFHSFFSSLARTRYSFKLSFYSAVSWNGKVTIQPVLISSFFSFFFFWSLSLSLVVWLRTRDLFVSQNPSHSPGRVPEYAFTICSYGQISAFCSIPSGHFYSHTLFALTLIIH